LRDQVETMLAAHDDAVRLGERPLRGLDAAASLTETALNTQTLDVFRVPGAPAALEIQELLRRRLMAIALISFGVNGFFNFMRFFRLDRDEVLGDLVPAAVYLTALAVIALILRRRWANSVTRLRYVEAALFAITTLYFLRETYVPLFVIRGGWLVSYAQRHVD